ncbi:MAG TPA: glucose-6-phosphate dehydrogenase [Ignavibacteriaceae bacterium]|nr:glucose-6-phosphate dehydrogenase [Ignavibacteriaceae bacterium]
MAKNGQAMKKPENHILVIFGALGDLTKRKLMPAIFQLKLHNMLPEKFAIIGTGRKETSDSDFRNKMKDALNEFSEAKNPDKSKVDEFLNSLYFAVMDFTDDSSYPTLKNKLEELSQKIGTGGNVIFYLATPPSLYGIIPVDLAKHGMSDQSGDKGWKKIIIEKPFGYDLKTAKELNNKLLNHYEEDQIYRIDHYLGKETVQNIMVTRFSNGIFEPLWNRNYIHHVEITSAENIGVENRGGYYDDSGALRDMVQNHLLQLTGVIAMEPPASFDSNAIRNETLKIFQALRIFTPDEVSKNVIRGQYGSAKVKGEQVAGYREEKGVKKDSRTETFVAIKMYIDNWRWGGVPFYIRTGKRLPTRVTEVVIHFKPTPHQIFSSGKTVNDSCNQLIIRIQPDEGLLFKIGMKTPGAGYKVQTVNMDFHYSDLKNESLPSAYQRLIHDCMIGDPTLFARADAVEACWTFVQPIIDAWKENKKIKVYGYPAGTWGPEHADNLIEEPGVTWRYPCKNLADDGLYCEL